MEKKEEEKKEMEDGWKVEGGGGKVEEEDRLQFKFNKKVSTSFSKPANYL